MKTEVIKIHPEFPELEKIARCAKVIRKGGLVVFPTETVYGIAADFNNEKAMERLREVKKRPEGKPFSIHISQKALLPNYTPMTDPVVYKLIDAYWRAANYLSVGQIYLMDNPLLITPLKKEHIKPRLLGHWGTTPGLNFIYVHLNRIIKKQDLSMIYINNKRVVPIWVHHQDFESKIKPNTVDGEKWAQISY